MESNWIWNGWYGSKLTPVWDIAAHLLVPIDGRDWIGRTAGEDPPKLQVAFQDIEVGWVVYNDIATVPPTGFPYWFPVDQTRLE